ncbi:MAG: putative transposase YbfD/YdcC [Paraglaciecola sp.]|jgi:predicted transposase YbfD/YdcC
MVNTQKKSANSIVEKGGDYLSALKGKQSSLHDDVTLFFENTPKSHINRSNIHKTTDAEHGRIEEREVMSCHDIDWLIKDH